MSIKEEREGFAHKSEHKKAELIEDCCNSTTGNKGFKGIFTEKFSFSITTGIFLTTALIIINRQSIQCDFAITQ